MRENSRNSVRRPRCASLNPPELRGFLSTWKPPQRRGAGAHLVGERRQAQVDPLAGVALALPVQWLTLAARAARAEADLTHAHATATRALWFRSRLLDRRSHAGWTRAGLVRVRPQLRAPV